MKKYHIAIVMGLFALLPLESSAQNNTVPANQPTNNETTEATRMPRMVVESSQERIQDYLASYDHTAGTLYPTQVTMPYFNGIYAGNSVEVGFTVDASGHPRNVRILSGTSDIGLATLITDAVRGWRFSPQQRDGANVSTDATLRYSILGSE